MERVDTCRYDDGNLEPVRLAGYDDAVIVTGSRPIPCHREIRRVTAGIFVVTFGLGLNYGFEGGVQGVFHQDGEAHPASLEWVDGPDIWLMAENSQNPLSGDSLLLSYVYNFFETAVFDLARDASGYPLILSSESEVIVRHILLEAARRHAGGRLLSIIKDYVESGPGHNLAHAGLF